MTPRLTRAERREQTREALLEAAAQLFAVNGVHATTLDAVAEAAGLTKGAVYSNFDGKDDLVRALIGRQLERDGARWRAALETDDPAQRLQGMIGVASSAMHTDPRWIALELQFHLYAQRDAAAREILHAHYREVKTQIHRALEGHAAELAPVLEALALGLPALSLGLGVLGQLEPVPKKTWATLLERLIQG